MIGLFFSLDWGVIIAHIPGSTATPAAPCNNHGSPLPFGHPGLCHIQVRFAIISGEACSSLAWNRKSVQGLKQVVDISSYREISRAIMYRWSCSIERWDETWWDGNSLFSISSTDDFCIHHGWMIATLYCARLWISQTCKDSEAGVHNPPTLALLSKGYFFFVCCFIL